MERYTEGDGQASRGSRNEDAQEIEVSGAKPGRTIRSLRVLYTLHTYIYIYVTISRNVRFKAIM